MKRWRLLPAAFVGLLTLTGIAFAQDSDQTRFYLGLRLGAQLFPDSQIANGIEATKLDFPAYGASVGVNFGRYFGLELAADTFEPSLRTASLGTLGDWSVWTLVPQARLRYPLLDGQLTPYAIAGVGIGFAQFNDRKPSAAGVHIEAKDMSLVGAVGAGLEYFVANNIAAGIEARYLALRDQRVEVADLTRQTHPDSLLLTFGLRLFFPEVAAGAPSSSSRAGQTPPELERARDRDDVDASELHDAGRTRFYLGLHVGAQTFPDRRIVESVEASSLQRAYGASVGMDFGRYSGVEVAADGYGPTLRASQRGAIGEYALWTIIPQIRLRYPLLEGRLTPYLIAGVGVGFTEFKNRKPHGIGLSIHARDTSAVGSVGAGIDYFVVNNIAVGAETKYLVFDAHRFEIEGVAATAHPKAFVSSVGLRIFFPELIARSRR
jgi:opacity protein-like surface antigen